MAQVERTLGSIHNRAHYNDVLHRRSRYDRLSERTFPTVVISSYYLLPKL